MPNLHASEDAESIADEHVQDHVVPPTLVEIGQQMAKHHLSSKTSEYIKKVDILFLYHQYKIQYDKTNSIRDCRLFNHIYLEFGKIFYGMTELV